MRIEIAPNITVAELQRVAAAIGAKLYALPDGGIAIRKPTLKENPKCPLKK